MLEYVHSIDPQTRCIESGRSHERSEIWGGGGGEVLLSTLANSVPKDKSRGYTAEEHRGRSGYLWVERPSDTLALSPSSPSRVG